MWSKGEINGYYYEVKHFDEPSEHGIRNGRVSKLCIRKDGIWVYNYDRELEYDRLDPDGKAVYKQILKQYN
jgi:hypothetical protein